MDVTSFSYIVAVILIFVDGLVFGVAASRGVVSIILIIVGLLLASFIGLSIPFLANANGFMSGIESLFTSTVNRYGPAFFAMPILWILGFAAGLFLT